MRIQNDFPLSQILWYKIGGHARHLLEVENAEDLQLALDFIEKNNQKNILICGLGSNLIFSGDYFDGTVIIMANAKAQDRDFKKKDEFITVFSGIILDDLIQYMFKNNLTGLEWAGGLPGTVGAGIRGNVGAFSREIQESLVYVEVLERQGARYMPRTLKKDELHFSYRSSLIKENRNMIIVSATFRLIPGDAESLEEGKSTYAKNIAYRREHHPMKYPTCGSVFKNISDLKQVEKVMIAWPDIKEAVETKWHGKVSMGYIINRLGFSGFKIGKMQVSEKHANFIVNLGDGKGRDVIMIIKEIQDKVQGTFGFTPEVEVEIVL
jgi:UDP-N-acetylmuramate dehydrogenase